ncbi:hypothetical protein NE619_10485 [Anaerovorax odorimutans]|uniref:Uncharacterized protein n=1 Tax=Anaerovorax odorimutans TaxID=109327 RepID=A0ABT1RPN0_9FIRM|nr:hypothetical protein [Anaerovorax odorimutans]
MLQALLTNVPIKTGTDNDWYYKKYADGTFEAWVSTGTIIISGLAQTGYNYYKTVEVTNLPTLATEVTSINISANSSDFWVGSVGWSLETRKISAFMLRSINYEYQASFSLHMFGKWK